MTYSRRFAAKYIVVAAERSIITAT